MALNISKIGFNYKISNINKLRDHEWTPSFTILGVPWKIQFCKEDLDEKHYLASYLHCENEDKSQNWSYTAWITIKLLPFDRKKEVHRFCSAPDIFDYTGSGYGDQIIEWCKLFDPKNDFVKDNTINLEILVETIDPNGEQRSALKYDVLDACSEKISFRLTVSNIGALMVVRTPKFILQNLHWNMKVFKSEGYLGICLEPINHLEECSCEMKASFKLTSYKGKSKSIKMEREQKMEELDTMKIEEFIPWNRLLDEEEGFVMNNQITLEVEANADNPVGVIPNAPTQTKLMQWLTKQ